MTSLRNCKVTNYKYFPVSFVSVAFRNNQSENHNMQISFPRGKSLKLMQMLMSYHFRTRVIRSVRKVDPFVQLLRASQMTELTFSLISPNLLTQHHRISSELFYSIPWLLTKSSCKAVLFRCRTIMGFPWISSRMHTIDMKSLCGRKVGGTWIEWKCKE